MENAFTQLLATKKRFFSPLNQERAVASIGLREKHAGTTVSTRSKGPITYTKTDGNNSRALNLRLLNPETEQKIPLF